MKKVIATGIQDYESLRMNHCFYVDKTEFIREWWNNLDAVTLITRPRRFGKTLNMSMLNCFFSNKFENRGELFEGLKIWEDADLRKEQGKWPVIFLSFANIKQNTWDEARMTLNTVLAKLYNSFDWMIRDRRFTDADRALFYQVKPEMGETAAAMSLLNLCEWMERYYGKKILIFLDEYDTPMQEAWLAGYWDKMINYIRNLFNSTFKTNPSLERAILTGITRISKESIFSDLNNLTVITTTSRSYATAFGFTENEVFEAMDTQGCPAEEKKDVKAWYDGFNFGTVTDIYNPWSVTNYLDTGELKAWWANSSSNGLINQMIRHSTPSIKRQFESLLKGETLTIPVNEEIVFNRLGEDPGAIWSLMLASGYLKVVPAESDEMREKSILLTLAVTNKETMDMLEEMVKNWFGQEGFMPPFLKAMLKGDAKTMGRYLNEILLDTISSFDSGKRPSRREPENFYHGLVLGLVVENAKDYCLRSNRESGFGRYDVMMEPKREGIPAVILEFKVFDPEDEEKTIEDTAANALRQIDEMQYDRELLARGIPQERILKYGIAFEGKKCIVRKE